MSRIRRRERTYGTGPPSSNIEARERGWADYPDADTAARGFIGPLLTHIVVDGLLLAEQPRPPGADAVERLVDLHLRAVGPR